MGQFHVDQVFKQQIVCWRGLWVQRRTGSQKQKVKFFSGVKLPILTHITGFFQGWLCVTAIITWVVVRNVWIENEKQSSLIKLFTEFNVFPAVFIKEGTLSSWQDLFTSWTLNYCSSQLYQSGLCIHGTIMGIWCKWHPQGHSISLTTRSYGVKVLAYALWFWI